MLQVVQVVKPMGNGRTHPFLVKCNDNRQYVIKMKNDYTYTHKAEFNELVAYKLAKILQLPIPAAMIVNLPQSIIDGNKFLSDVNASSGLCFASEYRIGTTYLTPFSFEFSKNQKDIPGIFLFDEIILNDDRWSNYGNLFFDNETSKIMIFDHSDIFKNGQIWTSYELKSYQHLPPTIVSLDGENYENAKIYVKGNDPFALISEKVKMVGVGQIANIFINIPMEWNIDKNEIIECENFINFQIENYTSILEEIHKYFPFWKGGDIKND